ncbi:leucine--tRNA ligase [Nanchangia anserum]|uniref:Leucine--tRNA ligase n=1 Tax=Nanchangia anserum TaxID=2692125 RepID=A0A8I0GBS0_9ACTO|nr:class I tRNA ligase family protein [Nanchangia anserum]MBD3689111.1 leucine--tRNA ligase [Nanchangia anserum]QOX81346.1 leucine--tRNA ligase [Nanchangia anserum]
MTEGAIDQTAHRYTAELAGRIEQAWQARWSDEGSFHADNPTGTLAGPLAEHPPFFLLDMFPYPSGKGLHVGHPLGYIATDVVARYNRMQGKNVLYTMGFDAFGLPAEQYAVQTGQHPAITTRDNIANIKSQLARLGLSHDLRRSFATTDPDYVKWTQWIFLQIFNSWYDPEAPHADGSTGTARPISELVEEFARGTRPTPDGRAWADLDERERARILDGYRLAYVSEAPVNWCPGLGTVLADEEVTNEGRSERGNYPVFKTKLRQWMMRMTAYADRLAEDLDLVDWPDKVRTMQRNWIGKSHGATVRFGVPAGDGREASDLEVYTTRPDTLFGATFMVIAPEHPLVGAPDAAGTDLRVPAAWPEGTREAWTGGYASPAEAVDAYRAQARAKTEKERSEDSTEKTGVFTGIYATNPVNGRPTPIFVADYVLMGYGTGAIMAVPAHDDRDWAFAKRFDLDIITTISPGDEWDGETAWTGDGVIENSANDEISLNGLGKTDAIAAMTTWLEQRGLGEATTTYRLRDWLFSRQRFWGEPFPVVHGEDGRVHALPESMLPIELPELDDFTPRTFDPDDAHSQPASPLTRAEDWVRVELDLGEGLQTYYRDTNTMPNWAGSCYYEIRYLDPADDARLVADETERYWMGPREGKPGGGADLYVGGVEHAVLHLLYARFWQKVLYDLGIVSAKEPFHHLFNQGMIEAYAYVDSRGQYVPADEVEGDETDGFTWQGQPVERQYGKMGKSLKNIVTPDDMCATYGADTFRLYEMSMGPLDMSRPWETRAVVGSYRFCQRLWRNVIDEATGEVTVVDDAPSRETAKLVARTIADVTEEYNNLRINTAIAKMIVLNNHLVSLPKVPRAAIEPLILMVAPIAPHIAEELWARLGHEGTLVHTPFPEVVDPTLLEDDTVTCVVQINGKVKYRIEVSPSIDAEELQAQALAAPPVVRALDGRDPLKTIVRAPKLVNVVVPKEK